MLTRKQAREQRRALEREIKREHKKKVRAKLGELRGKLREAHAEKKTRLKEIVDRCRTDRLTVRDRLREHRARVLAELRETARAERAAARQACLLRKGEAKASCSTAIGQARAALAAERTYHADLRRIERDNRTRHKAHARTTQKERRGESDDEVRQNIPSDLVPLFERVKRGIRATPRMSRAEVFLKYAQEHPHEVFEVIDLKTERMIRDLEKKHAEAARKAARGPGPARVRLPPASPRRTYTAAELADVPF